MKKTIKLINNERTNVKVLAAKACESGSYDICETNIDNAKCSVESYDLCYKDYAACTNNSYDNCSVEDHQGCYTGVMDNCSTDII